MIDASEYYCYFNDDLLKYKDFRIHVSDLGLQRGYGIFDFFRVRKGEIVWLDDYLDRLFHSIRLSDFAFNYSKEDVKQMVYRLHEMNNIPDSAFKAIVTGGMSENLAHVDGDADLFLLNVPWTRPPADTYENGVQLLSYKYGRPEPDIKTLNYSHTLRLRNKMKEIGAVDLMYHRDVIFEASRANLFFVKKNRIYTPGKGMLQGITRKQVLRQFPEIIIQDIPYDQLYAFDEVFMSSTSRDITPIIGVNGRRIGDGKPGSVTREISSMFQ